MKYCPNPACPHRLRRRAPAEFLDRATVCNDCGMPLVEAEALGTPETMHAVSSFHARETRAGAATKSEASSGKVDIATGWCLIVLSVALLVGSYLAAEGIEGGRFYISIGPFAYGMMRLFRGMDARKAYRAQQGRTEAS